MEEKKIKFTQTSDVQEFVKEQLTVILILICITKELS